jgi:hypothetical protein
VKVAEIKLDILKGSFDTTLEKYKPVETVIAPVAAERPAERKELDWVIWQRSSATGQHRVDSIDKGITYKKLSRNLATQQVYAQFS